MREESEEILIGKHESGVMLEEGLNTNSGKYYCGNCNKNIHCHVVVNDGTAEIIKTCKNDECQCRCRTHFACKKCGRLHAYGTQCDYKEPERKYNPKEDERIAKMMEDWKLNKK